MKSDHHVGGIRSRGDFASFVRELRHDLEEQPENWGNSDLNSFLDAMAAWTEDIDGYYQNLGEQAPEQPTWKIFGEILLAARVYE